MRGIKSNDLSWAIGYGATRDDSLRSARSNSPINAVVQQVDTYLEDTERPITYPVTGATTGSRVLGDGSLNVTVDGVVFVCDVTIVDGDVTGSGDFDFVGVVGVDGILTGDISAGTGYNGSVVGTMTFEYKEFQ